MQMFPFSLTSYSSDIYIETKKTKEYYHFIITLTGPANKTVNLGSIRRLLILQHSKQLSTKKVIFSSLFLNHLFILYCGP